MKLSISNLCWGNTPIENMARKLSKVGIQGIEIAPTAVWKNLDEVSKEKAFTFRAMLLANDLAISGVQSLLFGQPSFQLFDKSSWPAMELHLHKVIQIAGFLGASVAVFGSPKNRVRGNLSYDQSNEIASIFLKRLIPHLEEANLVLTLEPNAPQYGADFLTNYREVVQLSEAINSTWIKPQIDTGCAAMVGEKPEDLFREFTPRHIHLSAPHLGTILPIKDNLSLLQLLAKEKYQHWIVIEMLNASQNGLKLSLETAKWVVDEARTAQKNVT